MIPKKDHSFNSENICTVCGYELQITLGLTYEEYEDPDNYRNMVYAVTGIGIATDRDIVIPAYHMGKAVRKIATSAFSGKDIITSVFIPSSIEEIESKAFYYCSSLEKMMIPASLKTIGAEAFAYCSKLSTVTLFDNLKEIGASAFNGCTKLSEIELPDQGIKIGAKAFYNTAYYNQRQNWQDGVLYLGNHLLATNELFKSESYTILSTVKSIASSAFANQSVLKEIVMQGSYLTNAGYYVKPNIVGENIFSNTNLTKAAVSYSCLELLPANNITDLTVTNGSIRDELREFKNLKNLSVDYFYQASFYLPLQGLGRLESLKVTKLDGYRLGAMFGKEYFNGAVSVAQKSATYDSKTDTYTLSSTADSYYVPSSLRHVTVLSGSVTRCAFYGCTMLTDVTYGKDVTMGSYALFGCTNVEYLNYLGDLEEYCIASKEELFNCINNSYDQLQHATIKLNGNVLQGEITVPSSVTNLVTATFEGQTKITKINLPDGLKSIGKFAFGCSGITSIEIPESVISIENDAFNWCKSLTSVKIGNGVTSIGSDAFRGCSGLTEITIPDSVRNIGNYAFYNCSGLTGTLTIPNSVTSIGNRAFYNCSDLTGISVARGNKVYHSAENCLIETASKTLILGCNTSNIPADGSVESIGEDAFYGCSGLTSVTIPDSVTSIGAWAFVDCGGLTTVNWNAENCTINGYSRPSRFAGCTKLTTLNFGENVQVIPSYAFEDCSSLTSVTIPNGVTSIGDHAFYNCSGLTSVTIGSGVTSIGEYAFGGCSGLTSITFENTDGWWVSTSNTATSGMNIISSDLADPATAATYLTSTYYFYYWKRS